MPLILGTLASSVQKVTGSFESIATFTAAGTEQNFSFTSIPSTYQHLQIRFAYNSTAATALNAQLNSITSGYTRHKLLGDGATATATGNTAQTSIEPVGTSTGSTGYFATGIIDIHDYASTTKNKTIRCFTGVDKNGSGRVELSNNLVQTTSAISSIYFDLTGNATFLADSTFALYGVKGV
jgi:hypothetical protein